MSVHLPTLFLVLITVSASMTVALAVTSLRDNDKGVPEFAQAMGLYCLTYLLLVLMERQSDLMHIGVVNITLAVCFSRFVAGIHAFQDRPQPRYLIWLPVLIVVVINGVYLDQPRTRILLGSLAYFGQMVQVMQALLAQRHNTVGIGQYYLLAGFGGFLGVFALRAGALLLLDDYAVNVSTPNLVQTLSFLVSIAGVTLIATGSIVMAKERSDERNRRLAMVDELTGLANRRHVLEMYRQQLAAASRYGQPLSLLMFDIDHFKRINDSHGHPAGDETLRQVAACLRARVRTQDIVGRIGGEEFLVVLPQTPIDGAVQLAQTLRQAVESLNVVSPAGDTIPVTISIGVCGGAISTQDGADELIATADAALYRAKSGGRNRVECCSR